MPTHLSTILLPDLTDTSFRELVKRIPAKLSSLLIPKVNLISSKEEAPIPSKEKKMQKEHFHQEVQSYFAKMFYLAYTEGMAQDVKEDGQ